MQQISLLYKVMKLLCMSTVLDVKRNLNYNNFEKFTKYKCDAQEELCLSSLRHFKLRIQYNEFPFWLQFITSC